MRIDILKNEVVVNEKSIKIGGEIDSANAALNDKTCYDSEFYYENGDVLINIENDCISYIEIRNGYKSEKYVKCTKNVTNISSWVAKITAIMVDYLI